MKRAILFALAAMATAPAAAQVNWYLGGGTTGIGGGAAFKVNPAIDVRVQYLGGATSGEFRSDGIDYKQRVKLSNLGFIGDYYFTDKFHLSAGLYYAKNKITLDGRPSSTGTYTINGTTYSSTGATVTADTELTDGVAPYLGVGWATRPSAGKGFGFRVEVGALVQKPKTRLTQTGLTGPTVAQDLAAEETRINDKLARYRLYPVAAGYVTYGF
jgi:hypothetical protein